MTQTQKAYLLLITGTVGVGKSSVADAVVQTENKSIGEVVQEVIACWTDIRSGS